MRYLLSFFLLAGLMSCSSSKVSKYSKIEYEVGPCFGFCPIYKIIINADKTAILEAEHFNFSKGEGRGDLDKPREGTYRSVISKEDFDKLMTLADQANVKSLKGNYEDQRIMDASRTSLSIFFSDGSLKNIAMSAGEKPENLVKLVQYIIQLKEKQNWKKIN